jgi:hypothetical protein
MIVAVAMGTLLGLYVHNDYVKWGHRGRDAFLAYQSHRFDQYMSLPYPAMISIIESIVFVAVVLAVYETVASVLSGVLKSSVGWTDQ